MTVILFPSNTSVNRKTIYNIIKIETDGYSWIFTPTYGEIKIESRDDYSEIKVQ